MGVPRSHAVGNRVSSFEASDFWDAGSALEREIEDRTPDSRGIPSRRLNGLSRITPAWLTTQFTQTGLRTQFPADREKSREIPPSGSKLTGELDAVPLPERADWLPDFESELFAFPGPRHDQHDSISQALFNGVRPGTSAAHLLAPLIGYPGEAIRFFLASRRIVTGRTTLKAPGMVETP
jgi:hypothetical protein